MSHLHGTQFLSSIPILHLRPSKCLFQSVILPMFQFCQDLVTLTSIVLPHKGRHSSTNLPRLGGKMVSEYRTYPRELEAILPYPINFHMMSRANLWTNTNILTKKTLQASPELHPHPPLSPSTVSLTRRFSGSLGIFLKRFQTELEESRREYATSIFSTSSRTTPFLCWSRGSTIQDWIREFLSSDIAYQKATFSRYKSKNTI